MFTAKNLKTGHILENRNGDFYVVLLDTFLTDKEVVGIYGCFPFEEGFHSIPFNNDIIAIYEPPHLVDVLAVLQAEKYQYDKSKWKLIWTEGVTQKYIDKCLKIVMEDIKKEAEQGSFYVYTSYSNIFDNKTTLKNGDTTDNLAFREVIKQLKSLGYVVTPYDNEFRIYWRTIIE